MLQQRDGAPNVDSINLLLEKYPAFRGKCSLVVTRCEDYPEDELESIRQELLEQSRIKHVHEMPILFSGAVSRMAAKNKDEETLERQQKRVGELRQRLLSHLVDECEDPFSVDALKSKKSREEEDEDDEKGLFTPPSSEEEDEEDLYLNEVSAEMGKLREANGYCWCKGENRYSYKVAVADSVVEILRDIEDQLSKKSCEVRKELEESRAEIGGELMDLGDIELMGMRIRREWDLIARLHVLQKQVPEVEQAVAEAQRVVDLLSEKKFKQVRAVLKIDNGRGICPFLRPIEK